jgi:hypothetical protein
MSDIPRKVLFIAAVFVAGFAVSALRYVAGRRLTRRIRAGRPARIPCDWYPAEDAKPVRAHAVVLAGAPLYLLRRGGPALRVEPGGTVRRQFAAGSPRSGRQGEWTGLAYRAPDSPEPGGGGLIRLSVPEEHVEALSAALEARATGAHAPRRMPLRIAPFAVAATAVALLGAAALTDITLAGRTVTATATRVSSDDYCHITWPDPWDNSRQTAEIDCVRDEGHYRKGDQVTALALPFPFRGNAFDTDSVPLLSVLEGIVLGGVLLGTVVPHVRWRRRYPKATTPSVPRTDLTKETGPRPAPGPFQLTYAAFAEAAAESAGSRQRSVPRPRTEAGPLSGPWWRHRTLRRLTVRNAVSPIGLLLGLGAGFALTDPALHQGTTLTFALCAVLAAGAARVIWCLVRSVRLSRELWSAAQDREAEPYRYVLLHNVNDGEPWCVLFPADAGELARPVRLLPLMPDSERPLPPPVGTLTLGGGAHDGDTAVPLVDGRPVWPSGPVVDLLPGDEDDEWFVRSLVTPYGEEDGEDAAEEATPPGA